jgi:hypothetical protein
VTFTFFIFYLQTPTTHAYPEPDESILQISPAFKVPSMSASMIVGPYHHAMARPQVADGGTACNMEGSCEYIE